MVEKTLTFADVKEDQFFIGDDGTLAQKIGDSCYNTIADKDGNLFSCSYEDACVKMTIKEILPITKLTKEMLLKVVKEGVR